MSTAEHRKSLSNSRRGRALARQRQAARSRHLFVAGPVGLVALFGLAILLSSSAEEVSTEDPQTRPVVVTGDALPALSDTDQAIGMTAPQIEGTTFDGKRVTIESDGRPKMILFLAHWCPHCQKEVPLVQSWLEAEGMPQGVELVSVATATDPVQPNYPPSEWLEREGWTVPVIVDDQASSAGTAFGVSSYPFFVFVGADGSIVHRAAGELPIDHIEGILGGL